MLEKHNFWSLLESATKVFSTHSNIHVRVNGQLSRKIDVKNGVPQGSVLSVTLFLVAFNDIDKCFTDSVKSSRFANDITMCCKAKDLETTEKQMQKSLNAL